MGPMLSNEYGKPYYRLLLVYNIQQDKFSHTFLFGLTGGNDSRQKYRVSDEMLTH